MDANLFAAGSIFYYENKTNSKRDYKDDRINHDFLVSRPVYIIEQTPAPYDDFTINVLAITSSKKRVGIPINITGLRNGQILPNRIYSIHKEYLTSYMGRASDIIMEEVSNALKYHMNFTDVKPNYLVEYENDINKTNEIINSLTVKEKSVYDFIMKKCVLRDIYYSEFDELYTLYSKINKKDENIYYDKAVHFSKALNKVLALFPDVEIKVENHVKRYYGISINGNTHKYCNPDKSPSIHVDLKEDELAQLNHEDLTRDELLNQLSSKSREIYNKYDIIDKFKLCRIPTSKMKVDRIDQDDLPIIRSLIEYDVNKKKETLFQLLDKGYSPIGMNTIFQYAFYTCAEDEIMAHLDKRHLKKGGLPKIMRNIKNNIGYLISEY